ncbi:NAD(P)-dependent oxidoreductase [Streptomyces sp. NBC_01795]|uniref:NAD-dependent epimerase/dehydratase family protein n=1 Tax=unclassified Streptomyces TaxID=2593676 RepID=UPI002DD7C1FA|nr:MULTISPECIES: NAD(P)-dependent oxidoreductase [unclassified Streptomyces]WSA96829.1 NAD(P)-dependent oxidoreductase [Streptomyces sp. NBC_01795]WSB81245.1 NAD(P)-dependent oxidoreductase [Streptomyces sp. NBC_01775]
MQGKKILVTGGTGQVARPVAEALAADNEVWCLGRFGDLAARKALEEQGARTLTWDMATDDLEDLPRDFTHVLHSAVHRGDGQDFGETARVNAVGTARLMTHCAAAEAFLYVSSGVVYNRADRTHRYREDDPLGATAPWLPTYPIAKLSAEGVVQGLAEALSLPAVIARLNIAYGPYGHGGVPMILFNEMRAGQPCAVPREGQNYCNLLHTDDVVRQVPLLWEAARAPARVVNWGGDEEVGITDLLEHMSALTGVPVRLERNDYSRETAIFDHDVRRGLIGDCSVGWRTGIARTLAELFEEYRDRVDAYVDEHAAGMSR